jgi:hypothetical protein
MYYYTKSRPSFECVNNNCFGYHATLFQRTQCRECSDSQCYQKNDEPVLTPA